MKNERIVVELELKKVNDANKETEKLIENLEKARKLLNEINGDKIYVVAFYDKEIESIFRNKNNAEVYCKRLNKDACGNEFYVKEYDIEDNNISEDFMETLEESMEEYDETLKKLGDD